MTPETDIAALVDREVCAWIREDLDTGAKMLIGFHGLKLIARLNAALRLRYEGDHDLIAHAIRAKYAEIDLRPDVVTPDAMWFAEEYAEAVLSALRPRYEGDQDKARLDWLEQHNVEVRDPLVHGSRHLFFATVDESFEGEDRPSDLRAKIDAALSSSSQDSLNTKDPS